MQSIDNSFLQTWICLSLFIIDTISKQGRRSEDVETGKKLSRDWKSHVYAAVSEAEAVVRSVLGIFARAF
jgi:hypothetical protein